MHPPRLASLHNRFGGGRDECTFQLSQALACLYHCCHKGICPQPSERLLTPRYDSLRVKIKYLLLYGGVWVLLLSTLAASSEPQPSSASVATRTLCTRTAHLHYTDGGIQQCRQLLCPTRLSVGSTLVYSHCLEGRQPGPLRLTRGFEPSTFWL